MSIIQDVVVDMQGHGIDQWDKVYPDEETIICDLNNESLFVYDEHGLIKGLVVLNEEQDEEYKRVEWKFHSGKHLVVHRLCIDPRFNGQGLASRLMKFAEKYGKEHTYQSIRLDTFTKNNPALRLYEKLGYRKAGIVHFRKGEFYCFEKEFI